MPTRTDTAARTKATRNVFSFTSFPPPVQNAWRACWGILKKKGQCRPPPAKNQLFAVLLSRNSEKNQCTETNVATKAAAVRAATRGDLIQPGKGKLSVSLTFGLCRSARSKTTPGTINNSGKGGGIR